MGILDPMDLGNSRKENCNQLDAPREVNSGNRRSGRVGYGN